MIDFINYYFDLYPITINKDNDMYAFSINSENYVFIPYDRSYDEIDDLVKLNREMILSGSLVHEIIFNKFNKVLNRYDGKDYILLRVYVNINKKITINDIISFLNEGEIVGINSKLLRTNWANMWESKIDYFEYQMLHVIKKYRITYNIEDYYVGLGENAILYFKNVVPQYNGNILLGASHRRIGVHSTLFDLYNPLDLIIDYKVRDIAEYIKDALINSYNIDAIVDTISDNYYFDKFNLSLIVSRLLFPTYFFDIFDKIIDLTKKSSNIENFISKFIESNDLQSILWLKYF